MNILGINTSHNGSVCVLIDGKIDFFLEEERLSRSKIDDLPLQGLKFISENYSIDEIVVAGLTQHFIEPKYLETFLLMLSLLFPEAEIHNLLEKHHLSHALSSFHNSKFNECVGVVIDGNGSYVKAEPDHKNKVETESIFILNTDRPAECIYKADRLIDLDRLGIQSVEGLSLTKVYQCITTSLGFQWYEAGKTMGLSSYGKDNEKVPSLYPIGTYGSRKVFHSWCHTTDGHLREEYRHLLYEEELRNDLAWKVQQESQKAVGDLIERGIKETGLKQVCCSGGYFLNCVANYYLTKRFPDVKFYFEPISSDAGISIGAAKYIYQQKTGETTKNPQTTLYYGPKYSKKELLEGIKKYTS